MGPGKPRKTNYSTPRIFRKTTVTEKSNRQKKKARNSQKKKENFLQWISRGNNQPETNRMAYSNESKAA